MRVLAAIVLACLLAIAADFIGSRAGYSGFALVSAAHAQRSAGPDSVRIATSTGFQYVAPNARTKFGTLAKAKRTKAKDGRAGKAAAGDGRKDPHHAHHDRSIFTYALDKQAMSSVSIPGRPHASDAACKAMFHRSIALKSGVQGRSVRLDWVRDGAGDGACRSLGEGAA